MQQLVECVPNFSDGRNPEIYNGIAGAIRSVSGVRVLDVSADADHNRTVITFVGKPADVEEAAFRAIAKAAETINLDEHEGEHPRIGATDVFPFIPVRGITEDDCVAIANRVGKRVGSELDVPVYLYGSAATRPERKKLSAIRKGEYELWKSEVATNPERKPDYGPAEAKTWGATVIGVRPFLIAYNIFLNSSDVEVAETIARNIRFIGGGLRFVQAKGFLVEGQAQVSMNLTNFEKTPVYRVQELVRREAAQRGLTITKAELVGLIPQKSLMDSAKWYLQLDDLGDDQILEYRLYEEADEDITPDSFLQATASAKPTPGGGSVAALAGALSASLTQMVAGLTVGRRNYADISDKARAIQDEASVLGSRLTKAIAEDSASFETLMSVYRNKELDEKAKTSAIEQATIGAAEVPLNVARLSRDVLKLADVMVREGNKNAISDAAMAAVMARAAIQGAALNVKINAVGLKNQEVAQTMKTEVEALESEASMMVQAILEKTAERGNF